jgi:hypothetical protein
MICGHVAQSMGTTCHSLFGCGCYVKMFGVCGVRPLDLPHCIVLTNSDQPLGYAMCLVMYVNAYIFKFDCCLNGKGGRAGA